MSEGKRENIINAAVGLFAEKGFEGTSIRDISAKADVNVAMINYYFGTKEKLFEALVQNKAADTRGVLEAILKDDSLSEIEKMDRIVENYVERLFTGRIYHRVIHQELMLSHRESLQKTIVEQLLPNSFLIKQLIDKGIKKGIFKKVDAVLTIATLVGTINQVLLSKTMCIRMLDEKEGYMPYDDKKFKKRINDHIKQIMRDHLLK